MCHMSWCIMLLLTIQILIPISHVVSVEFSVTKNANNYGPYTVKWYNYALCRGPRSKNATLASSTFKTDEYGAVANYNTTFIVASRIDEIKIVVWNVNGAQKFLLWNYKVNKPCQHFVIAGLMEQYLHMHHCVVKPEVYIFTTNYTEVAQQFFGKSFFYGEYSFKINVFAKQGNVICILINAVFSKRV